LAQIAAVPSPKVVASVTRVFGAGAIATPVIVHADTVFRIARRDSLLGFAVVRAVKGKDQPITFLVASDTADQLKDVDILVYREPYGGEVAYEAWRRQFRGKTANDTLEVGRQIRSISGATISVNAVTAGVRRALADLTRWHREGAIK
jgi:Na+-translocating ferredoxin:NAD+ oxidoreductase RnfG subunit